MTRHMRHKTSHVTLITPPSHASHSVTPLKGGGDVCDVTCDFEGAARPWRHIGGLATGLVAAGRVCDLVPMPRLKGGERIGGLSSPLARSAENRGGVTA